MSIITIPCVTCGVPCRSEHKVYWQYVAPGVLKFFRLLEIDERRKHCVCHTCFNSLRRLMKIMKIMNLLNWSGGGNA